MIYITGELREQMIAHARREFPNEACGILSGSQGRVERVYAMTNSDKSSQTFFMDAREQLKVMKEIRARGQEMAGIYHSHVDSPAYPSPYDVRLALYPEASYLIVSIKDRENPSLRSFRIVEGKISEEELKVSERRKLAAGR